MERRPLLLGRAKAYGSSTPAAQPAQAEASPRENARVPRTESEQKEHKIGFCGLFRFTSRTERLLMLAGSLFASVHGVSYPILAMVFGEMTNTFLNSTLSQQVIGTNGSAPISGNEIIDSVFTVNASMALDVDPPVTLKGLADHLSQFSLYYLFLGFGVLTAATLQVWCWELACELHVHRLRHVFFAQVLRQDVAWYSRAEGGDSPGDIATRLSDDLERVREGTGQKLSMMVQYLATLVSGVAVGLVASWRLTLVLLGVGPLLVGATGHLANVVAAASRAEQKRYSEAGRIATQALTCIRTVAAFGGQQHEVNSYSRALKEGQGMALRKYLHMCVSLSAVHFLTFASYALAFWYGSDLIGRGLSTPGNVLTVFFSVIAGAFSIGNSLPFVHAVSTAVGAAASMFAVIDRVPGIDPYELSGLKLDRVLGKLELKRVTFEYPNRRGVKVLRDFNLSIEPGKTVALVGPSGAGKSTVISLLLRFYDAQHGQIMLDGVELQHLNLAWLRSQVGLVSQEPVLFSATICENIRNGRQGVSFPEVMQAAQTANAHEFITGLPDGYDTVVGEGGTRLSGGQKQRVAIARALVRDPKLLLLDEATSALDAESEGAVQAALDRAMWGRTTVIVAHRLSTIRNADLIYAMKDGELKESGAHEELMAKKGLYYHLVTNQAMKSVEETFASLKSYREEDEFSDTPSREAASKSDEDIELKRLVESSKSSSQPPTLGRELTADGRRKGANNGALYHLSRLLRLNSREWYLLIFGFLGCALTGSSMPAFALFYGEILNTFTLSGEVLHSSTQFWTYMFIALAGAAAVSWFMQVMSLSTASEFLVVRMRIMAFQNILNQTVGWFDLDNSSPRKLAGRLARDAPTVKAAAGWRVGQAINSVVILVESMLMAFLFGWKLALIVSVPVPLIVISHYKQAMSSRRHQRRDAELMSNSVRVASECVSHVRTVQSFGLEHHFLRVYSVFLLPPFREAKKHAYLYAIVYALTQSLIYTMYAIAFKFGAFLIDAGEMTPTSVYRVFFALAFCAPALGVASSYLQDYNKAKLSARLMIELIDQKPTFEGGSMIGVKPVIHGKIILQDVHFRYPARPDVEVLRGVTFAVEPGQTLALVGASGCGKSTIVSLIERFYDPSSGSVMVDGVDIRAMNLPHLRSHIGIVTQEPVLFDGSIRDNIAYGCRARRGSGDSAGGSSHVEMHLIIRAAKIANIHDFIASLPQRYDTLVGDQGAEVSGGQRQRIAIARAIVRNPRVLLLDEATSALDTENEKVVQEALDRARLGRTCIVVAHRLSTVQSADRIALIHRGRVAEMGSHQELQARRGRYYQLTRRQLSYPTTSA